MWRVRSAPIGALERAELGRNLVRRALLPSEPGLVVEVDAQRIGFGPVEERLLYRAGRGSLEHVGVGPIALGAEVHLVPAAHGAALHVVRAAAERGLGVGRVVLQAVVAEDQVEAHAVFAEDRHLRPLDAAPPVDVAERAAAHVAVEIDFRRGRRVVGRHGDRVMSRTQQPAAQPQMLGGCRRACTGADRSHGEHQRHPAAVLTGKRHGEVCRRQVPWIAADHGQGDLFIGLIRRASQRQRQLQRRPRRGRGRDQHNAQAYTNQYRSARTSHYSPVGHGRPSRRSSCSGSLA